METLFTRTFFHKQDGGNVLAACTLTVAAAAEGQDLTPNNGKSQSWQLFSNGREHDE
jgi:hypothetical protein